MALGILRGLGALWLALAVGAHAAPAEWRSIEGGNFSFATSYEGEPLGGSFSRFELAFRFDPDAPAAAQLVVSVDLTAADMGDPDMNAVLFDEAWFDIGRFATAVFESTAVQSRGEAEFVASGVLKLKGVERSVAVPFRWSRNGDRARMTGEFSLRRTDFGVGSGEWSTGDSIGLEVRLAFDIPLSPAD
ncbi:MAG: YceI family protein [Gammaproteobacteria bacterium]|nr:YceI family protein [Gammaproteobacteria bacterium]